MGSTEVAEKIGHHLVKIDTSFKGLDSKDNASMNSLKEQLATLAFLTKAQSELGEEKRSAV